MTVGGQNLLNAYAWGGPLGLILAPKEEVRQTEQGCYLQGCRVCRTRVGGGAEGEKRLNAGTNRTLVLCQEMHECLPRSSSSQEPG